MWEVRAFPRPPLAPVTRILPCREEGGAMVQGVEWFNCLIDVIAVRRGVT